MPPFRHILFPVDFSDRCRVAQPFVISMVRRFEAKLSLLHVIDLPGAAYGNLESPYAAMFDIPAMVKAKEEKLSEYLDIPELTEILRVVEHGDPAAKITAFAEKNNVDLIMMPTHGYGPFRNLLLGSVTAKVLHDSSCAVWTAAHTDDRAVADFVDCRSILCAVDIVPESAKLIRYAVELSGTCKAKLRLVHAATVPESLSANPREKEFRRHLLEWTRERTSVLQRQTGTDLDLCLECGESVASVVRGAALLYDADLVVIGHGKRQQSFGSLSTNAYAIICDSPCPVLRV